MFLTAERPAVIATCNEVCVVSFNKILQLHLHLRPSLNCSLLVLNFWANLSLKTFKGGRCLIGARRLFSGVKISFIFQDDIF